MADTTAPNSEILVARKLVKHFFLNRSSLFQKRYIVVKAVDGIDFTVQKGECLGLVGESGSGKSTTAYTVVGTYAPTGGSSCSRATTSAGRPRSVPLALKKDIQIVFQDPGSSLNPRRSIGDILEMPLRVHHMVPHGQVDREADHRAAGPGGAAGDLPLQVPTAMIGGGERQMVAIARALATAHRSSCWTSRPRRWTCPCRARSSTC